MKEHVIDGCKGVYNMLHPLKHYRIFIIQ